ncbi:hypothetical protein PMAYCL1PPCAC_21878 [Pristionchus mayeri]|uniref:SET domain-containing protein n=1 Tax=Pristionchus mayeri TaxID=1317129 RepID=A0AAN5CVP7_9BILA|nr:hypothetical protein PMAYCL1PPCAC_21878 [Pristionchus mayeri]
MDPNNEEMVEDVGGVSFHDTSQAIISVNMMQYLRTHDIMAHDEENVVSLAMSLAPRLERYSDEVDAGSSDSEEEVSADELVRKTMPTPYEPPRERYQLINEGCGEISLFNDRGDSTNKSIGPKFIKIDRNEFRVPWKEEPLKICCNCTDGCKDWKKCECRRHSKRAQLTVNGLQLMSPVGEYCLDSIQVYACGRECRCSEEDGCDNRVEWNEKNNELEIMRRDKDMGFEVRSLRYFRPGAMVAEFTGVYVVDSATSEEQDWAFVAYNGIYDETWLEGWRSERVFKKRIAEIKRLASHKVFLIPLEKGGIGRFVCHSRFPNCLPIRVYRHGDFIGFPRLFFFAWTSIAPGDMIKVDYGRHYHTAIIEDCCCGMGDYCECDMRCRCDEALCHEPSALRALSKGCSDGVFATNVLIAREKANRIRMMKVCMKTVPENLQILLEGPQLDESHPSALLIRNYRNMKELLDSEEASLATGNEMRTKKKDKKKSKEMSESERSISPPSRKEKKKRMRHEKETKEQLKKKKRIESESDTEHLPYRKEKKKGKRFENATEDQTKKKKKYVIDSDGSIYSSSCNEKKRKRLKYQSDSEAESPPSRQEKKKGKRYEDETEDGPTKKEKKKSKQLDFILDRPLRPQQISRSSAAEKKKSRVEKKDPGNSTSVSTSTRVDRVKNGEKTQKKKTVEAKKGGEERKSGAEEKKGRGRTERWESEGEENIDAEEEVVVISDDEEEKGKKRGRTKEGRSVERRSLMKKKGSEGKKGMRMERRQSGREDGRDSYHGIVVIDEEEGGGMRKKSGGEMERGSEEGLSMKGSNGKKRRREENKQSKEDDKDCDDEIIVIDEEEVKKEKKMKIKEAEMKEIEKDFELWKKKVFDRQCRILGQAKTTKEDAWWLEVCAELFMKESFTIVID